MPASRAMTTPATVAATEIWFASWRSVPAATFCCSAKPVRSPQIWLIDWPAASKSAVRFTVISTSDAASFFITVMIGISVSAIASKDAPSLATPRRVAMFC
ncbi:hypothetical protein D3C87_1917450 [compost metagenome]